MKGILAALQAIPKIMDGLTFIVDQIGVIIDDIKRAKFKKRIDVVTNPEVPREERVRDLRDLNNKF